MDPITAFGLAANVCQFVDFTIRVVSTGNKLRKSADGLLVEQADLYATSLKIIDLNNRLVESAKNHSQYVGLLGTNREIQQACDGMNQVTSDLVKVLDNLRMPHQKGRWKSMRQAVKAMVGKDGVDKMKSELLVHRQRLDTALLSSLWTKMDLFLSTEGLKEGDKKYASINTEMRDKTANFLFASTDERPPIWQTRLVHKVLENVWTTQTSANTESFSTEISRTAATRSKKQLQLQLIQELRFQDLSDREYRVTPAHEQTFHWIFPGPNHQHVRKWCLFAPWLQSSEKVYWITGKPGSGKSTLMKFLSKDPRTIENLSVWAADLKLVTAHFYFWNSGSKVQMSLHGFYRTIVHAILSKKPKMVPIALPNRWENSMLFGEDLHDWTDQELYQAYKNLIKKSGIKNSEDSYRLCLFIDGLDEYEGDHECFVQELSSLAATYDVKICVASRPWPVFENTFSTGAHLTLQDLTFPDIVRFTWSKLHGHRGFQNLLALEADYAGNLILEIANKSCGVFLWVDLVTKSLLEGLRNADGILDLQRRLEEMPGDLKKLYLKMFESIEPFYKEHASRYFRIAMAATGQLSALAFYFADDEDPNIALSTGLGPLTDGERQMRCQTIKTRINGRCKGFLEIPNPAPVQAADISSDQSTLATGTTAHSREIIDDGDEDASSASSEIVINRSVIPIHARGGRRYNEAERGAAEEDFSRGGGEPSMLILEPDQKVTYLHRTAKDFLETPEMRKTILEMSPSGFDPYISILSSRLLLIKTLPTNMVNRTALWHEIHAFLEFATIAELTLDSPVINDYLDELDRAASQRFRDFGLCGEGRHWTTTRWTSADSQHEAGFIALAAEYNLKKYIRSKLELGIPVFESNEGRPILDYIIEDYKSYPSLCEPLISGELVPSLRTIRLLLDRGEDPNARFRNSTTWSRVLNEASKVALEADIGDAQKILFLTHWADIIEIFIRNEADPLVNRNSPMASRVREIFGPFLPQRAKKIEKQLNLTKKRWASIGKFITPRNWKLDKLGFEITPLPVLKRLETAVIAPLSWSEHIRTTGGHRRVDEDDINYKMLRERKRRYLLNKRQAMNSEAMVPMMPPISSVTHSRQESQSFSRAAQDSESPLLAQHRIRQGASVGNSNRLREMYRAQTGQQQQSMPNSSFAGANNIPQALAPYISEHNTQLPDRGKDITSSEALMSTRPPSPIDSGLASLNRHRNRKFVRQVDVGQTAPERWIRPNIDEPEVVDREAQSSTRRIRPNSRQLQSQPYQRAIPSSTNQAMSTEETQALMTKATNGMATLFDVSKDSSDEEE